MKNLKKYLTAVLITGWAFTSCDDPERVEAEREFDEFSNYVSTNADRFDNDDDMDWDAYDSEWNEYDRGYQEHVTTIKDKRDYLSDEDRKEFDRIQTDYDRMRTRYETRASDEETKTAGNRNISNNMYAEVGISDPNNMRLDDVTETNYRDRYDGFVNYIDQNKTNFNQDDWENADRVNEAFRNKRNTIKNSITAQDNTEVDNLESRYENLRTTANNTNNSAANTNNSNTGTNNTGSTNR